MKLNPIKLNLGSESKRYDGFLNDDKLDIFKPDIVHNLEIISYPIENNSVTEIKMHHVLERVGQHSDLFNNIIKEIYRICQRGAIIDIRVPYPRHDYILSDSTHVRLITALSL